MTKFTDSEIAHMWSFENISEEDAIVTQRIFNFFNNMRAMGIDVVSRAGIMEAIGIDKDDIQPEDYEVFYTLGDTYVDNEEAINTFLEAKTSPKH